MATAPCLPPELWVQILRFATNVPDTFVSQPSDPFVLPPPLSVRQLQRELTRSLVTKRYVVLVCKTWYQCAISFLYSAVILNHGRGVSSLRGTLLESEARAEASLTAAHPLGWYTRRFDMVMHDSQTRHEYGEEIEQRMIYDILQCFPNLAQFFAGLRGRILDPSSLARRLAETCGRSLQGVHWANKMEPHLCPDQASWEVLLQACPNLRILQVPACKKITCSLRFPTLSCLAIASDQIQCRIDAPSLSRLIFHPPVVGAGALLHALSMYGGQLTTLEINNFPLRDLTTITTYCPNLKHIVLGTRCWSFFPEGVQLPSSITHVGISFDERLPRSLDFALFFTRLSSMHAPGLVVLRLINNHPNLRDYCTRFPRLACGLQLAGFHLEDRDGRAFT